MTNHDDTRTTVTALLGRIAAGDDDGIAALFAEQIDWRLDWPAQGHSALPWIRPRATRADAVEHFRELRAHHVPEKDASTVERILVDGADAVVLATIAQTVLATGQPYTAACALHLTVEDGQITRYHVYEDSLSVARAFGEQ